MKNANQGLTFMGTIGHRPILLVVSAIMSVFYWAAPNPYRVIIYYKRGWALPNEWLEIISLIYQQGWAMPNKYSGAYGKKLVSMATLDSHEKHFYNFLSA